jgi:hypothetical protein
MDDKRFQQMEKRLNEQAEATRAMNETLNKFIAIMGNQEAARNVAPHPPVSPPFATTTLQASHPSRVKPGVPSHFDGDRAQGHAFLTSCELYISLTQSDFIDDQVHIHWVLSYFKGGRMVSFAEHILRQELRSGKMCFASWREFTEEFVVTFCPENEVTTALMRLESDWYFQAKWNVEVYIDEFKDLVNLSGYTDPIAIVLKFRQGLNPTTQDRIAESGTDSVRGHPSIPLLPLFLTMSICIPHGLYTYPTTPVPLRPPRNNRRSSSISQYSTILKTSLQPRLMPRNYHRPHRDRVT